MSKYEFTPAIEELKKKYSIRADYLQKFLEKSGAASEADAIKLIEEKYGKQESSEEASSVQQIYECDSGDAKASGVQKSDIVSRTVEVPADENGIQHDASAKNSNDDVSKNGRASGNISEKLYIHRTPKSSNPFVHPVTGRPV